MFVVVNYNNPSLFSYPMSERKYLLSDAHSKSQLVFFGRQRGRGPVLVPSDARLISVLFVAFFQEILQTLELEWFAFRYLGNRTMQVSDTAVERRRK